MTSDVFASGLFFPEGPVALPDGSWLVVEGGERGCVTQITADGKQRRTVAVTGIPNGLAVDRSGFIWVAEPKVPSLLRVTLDGKVEVFMTECNGESFLYPNDLCFGPDGALYLTDSGITAADFEPGGIVRRTSKPVRSTGVSIVSMCALKPFKNSIRVCASPMESPLGRTMTFT